jgi:hypothetical protein
MFGGLWRWFWWSGGGQPTPVTGQPQVVGLLWDYQPNVILEWGYPKSIALVWED